MAYKLQSNAYRYINGVYFVQWSDVEDEFPQLIQEIKALGAKHRVITLVDKFGKVKRLYKEWQVGDHDPRKQERIAFGERGE
jgi:hypothetical protein